MATASETSTKTDNIPQAVAEISADLRRARNADDANRHAFAADNMARILTGKIKSDTRKAAIYAQWSSAMHHVAAAARYKAASFSAWNNMDAKSKVLNMESELLAAKGDAETTQRLVSAQ